MKMMWVPLTTGTDLYLTFLSLSSSFSFFFVLWRKKSVQDPSRDSLLLHLPLCFLSWVVSLSFCPLLFFNNNQAADRDARSKFSSFLSSMTPVSNQYIIISCCQPREEETRERRKRSAYSSLQEVFVFHLCRWSQLQDWSEIFLLHLHRCFSLTRKPIREESKKRESCLLFIFSSSPRLIFASFILFPPEWFSFFLHLLEIFFASLETLLSHQKYCFLLLLYSVVFLSTLVSLIWSLGRFVSLILWSEPLSISKWTLGWKTFLLHLHSICLSFRISHRFLHHWLSRERKATKQVVVCYTGVENNNIWIKFRSWRWVSHFILFLFLLLSLLSLSFSFSLHRHKGSCVINH